jgi:hypothetical protein
VFAPKVAKTQTKAPETSTSSLAHRSTLANALLYQSFAGSRVGRQLGARSDAAASGGDHEQKLLARYGDEARGMWWEFSKIPLFPPEQVSPGQPSSLHSAPPGRMQPKLAIGSIDDPLEREADAVADRVMGMPDPALSVSTAPEQISRKCADCQQEDENTLRAKPIQSPKLGGEVPPIVHNVLRAPGQPLNGKTRALFEPRFRRGFAGVRVHADAEAARSADAVGAMAYTVGSHIVFGSGRFAPGAESGKRLLAHELAHVVQQAGREAPPSHEASPVLETSAASVLMRTPLLSSTLQVCKRVLKGEHVFHVSDGGIIVTANARWGPSEEWQGEERPKCGNDEYHITLSDQGRIYDSDYGTCSFAAGSPFSRQWTDLPEKDYYLVIWTNNTNPNCCLEGEIEVSQEKGLAGESCTKPPPGPLEILHDALNIAGLVPALGAIPDAINAGIYLVEGDWANAGISAVAMIPIFGEAASVVKIGEKDALRVGGEAVTKAGKEEIAAGLKEAKAAKVASAEKGAAREAVEVEKDTEKATAQAEKQEAGEAEKSTEQEASQTEKQEGEEGEKKSGKGGKWTCYGRSAVLQIPSALPEHKCPLDGVYVNGPSISAPTEAAACLAAKHAFNAMMPRGCRPKHLACRCSKNR